MLDEQHHVAGRSKILDFGSELLQAFVLKNVCVFFSACGVRLWEDSRLLPAVPPTHSGCF